MSKEKETEINSSIELTEEEKKAIKAEAEKEVAKQLKDSKKKSFKEQALRQAKAEALFRSAQDETGEDMEEVYVDLASHPKYIMLDGKVYHSRPKPYKVTKAVAAVLREQMARGWDEEGRRTNDNMANDRQRHRQFRLDSSGRAKQVA